MPERAIPIALCATAWTAAASTIVSNPPFEEDIRLFGLTAGMAAFVWLRTSSPNLTRLGTYMYAKAVHDMTEKDGARRRGTGGSSGLGAMAVILAAASVLLVVTAPPPKAAEVDRPRPVQRPGPEFSESPLAPPRTEGMGRHPAAIPLGGDGRATARTTPLAAAASAAPTRRQALPPQRDSQPGSDPGASSEPHTDSGDDPAPQPKAALPTEQEPGFKPTLSGLLGTVPQTTGKLGRTLHRNDP